MYWRNDREEDDKGMLEMPVGTLNQDILLGDRGKTFCFPTGARVWCSREIRGVTDPGSGYGGGSGDGEGVRYAQGTAGKRMDN
jgi:hypothetical protein